MPLRAPVLLVVPLLAAVEVEPAKLVTADAAAASPGSVEATLGAAWSRSDGDRAGGTLRTAGATLDVTVGLRERLDCTASFGWADVADRAATPDRGDGGTDPALALRWQCLGTGEGARWWSLALVPTVVAPLGRGDDPERAIAVAGDCWSAGAVVAVSAAVDRFALGADAGWLQAFGDVDDRAGRRGTWSADVALGWQATAVLQPVLELNATGDAVDAGPLPWSLTATAGVLLAIPRGRLALGAQRTLAQEQGDDLSGMLLQVVQGF